MPAPNTRSRPHTSVLSARTRRITSARGERSGETTRRGRSGSCGGRGAGGSPPRGEGLLTCRMNAHGLDDTGHLEDGAHVLLKPTEPDIAAGGSRLLHGGDEGAHAGAVDVRHAVQIDEEARLAAVEDAREGTPHVVDRGHIEIPARRHHGHSARLSYVNVHIVSQSGSASGIDQGVAAPPGVAAGPRPGRYFTMVQRVPRSRATTMERLSAMVLTRKIP